MADYPKLMVLSENFRGMVFELKEDSVTVGRNNQRYISSYHCDFIHAEGGYFICDRDSTNGTRLNNVQLNPGEMYPLKNSDLLQLGSVEVMFDFNDGSSPTASRTETGIDLTSTQTGMSTVKDFSNLSPFASNESKSKARNRMMVIAAIGAAGLLILGLLGWLIVQIVNKIA